MIVSVALFTYNGMRFIREQLDSILAQSYADFELVICDDCSTDGTQAILAEYEKRDRRIRCFLNEKNLGINKNFEKAVSLCRGDYIAPSDQDDIWTPDHLEVLLAHKDESLLVCGQSEFMHADGTKTGIKRLSQEKVSLLTHDYRDDEIFHLLFFACFAQGCTTLFNRKLLEKVIPIPAVDTYDFWLALVASSLERIAFVDTVIVWYRVHDTNASKPDYGPPPTKIQKIKKTLPRGKSPGRLLRWALTLPFKHAIAKQNNTKEWVQQELRWVDQFLSTFSSSMTATQRDMVQSTKRYFSALANRTDLFFKISYFRKYYNILLWYEIDYNPHVRKTMFKKMLWLTFGFKGL